jgi:hypothetical protein
LMFGAVLEVGIPGAVLAGVAAVFLAGALLGGFWPDTVTAAAVIKRPSVNKRLPTAEVIPILLK